MRAMSAAARFYVLDGIDGCGKSTQASLLASALARANAGRAPLHLREPGSTPLGERVRALLLGREFAPSAAVELLLVAAARRAMLEERVGPALEAGQSVVCERFHSSTFAYQACAGGLPEDEVLHLLASWANEPRPRLVILLDLPVDQAQRRRRGEDDRIEAKGAAFQERVAEGYRRYAELRPFGQEVAVVDARGTVEEVHARVWERVQRAG